MQLLEKQHILSTLKNIKCKDKNLRKRVRNVYKLLAAYDPATPKTSDSAPPVYLSNAGNKAAEINKQLKLLWEDPKLYDENKAILKKLTKSHIAYHLTNGNPKQVTDDGIDKFLDDVCKLPEHQPMIDYMESKDSSFSDDVIQEVYDNKEAFRHCLNYLSLTDKAKQANRSHSAYALKHEVERFSKKMGSHGNTYVPTATFIFAALYSGFTCSYDTRDCPSKACFNIRTRSINNIRDKLTDNLNTLKTMPQNHIGLAMMGI